MSYPVWDVFQLGGGMLVTGTSVLYSLVAQFAAGGGLFLAAADAGLRRHRGEGARRYLRSYARLLVISGLLAGAAVPLVRTLAWSWVLARCLSLVAVSALLLALYGWDRLEAGAHQILIRVYAVAGWLSLLVLSGADSFLLPPADGLHIPDFWERVRHPAYLPSLIMRCGASLALAGLCGLAMAVRTRPTALRRRLVRGSGRWVLLGFTLLPAGACWYTVAMPRTARDLLLGQALTAGGMYLLTFVLSLLILGVVYFSLWYAPQRASGALAGFLLVVGLLSTGGTEWVRQAVRRPLDAARAAPAQVRGVVPFFVALILLLSLGVALWLLGKFRHVRASQAVGPALPTLDLAEMERDVDVSEAST